MKFYNHLVYEGHDMKRFLRSFRFALEGIGYCIKQERNFRVHLLAMVLVIIAGVMTKISLIEWLVITIFISGVLALELLNTAIERVVDLTTTEIHPLAKQAKDLAAGAVLLFALGSVVAACLIFIPKWFHLIN